jgi:hypothetical protein
MNRYFGWILIGLLTLPLLSRAADATWINNGTITVPPVIDATNVVNNGSMNILTPFLPFDTSNTRNFTNFGTMTGSVGFRFDTAPRNSSGQLIGLRHPAANFHNRSGATISATDSLLISGESGSYLLVSATNIINQGAMTVGVGGMIQLAGTNVNISRSALGVNPILPTGSVNGQTNFTPSPSIYDVYWGQDTDDDPFPINEIATGSDALGFLFASSPEHEVSTGPTAVGVQYSPFPLTYTNLVAAYTNLQNPTNWYIQAVFVGLSSTNMAADIRFSPSPSPTNGFRGIGIQMQVIQTNIITTASETNFIYFADTLASTTARGILPNAIDGTGRPANYVLSRQVVPQFTAGVTNNALFTPELLFNPTYDSVESVGPYAGYAAEIDNLSRRQPLLPSTDITNNPGRVEIRAQSLDMSRARIRTEGLLSIEASHLISSSNTLVDSENLVYKLGSTNGNLHVQGLMKESVNRLRGQITAWSAVWTNSFTPANDTNVVSLNFHVLILNAGLLQEVFPVNVYDFQATATNVVVSDNARMVRNINVRSDSLTLNGDITFTGSLQDWNQITAPTLRHFTNNGFLNIPNEAHFGDDRQTPYTSFINNGWIIASGQKIRSDYAEIYGYHLATAAFELEAAQSEMVGGWVQANGPIKFFGASNLLNFATLETGSYVEFGLTDSLSDVGLGSLNEIFVTDGIYMTTKPAVGDLLGTYVVSQALPFALVNHVWAGRDDGPNLSGFVNNVALGELELFPQGPDPLFVFSGVGAANGLYVSYLDLAQLEDYASQLEIATNLTIYFQEAELNFVPPGGVSEEEYLDGQFGGRLRWVPSAPAVVTVAINGGQMITVSSALRNSSTLDSDADGVANSMDAAPFDGVKITSVAQCTAPDGYQITWTAAPNTLYRLETSTNLVDWATVCTTTSATGGIAPCSARDTNSVPAGVPRYYRVLYNLQGL